jgi:ABC-type phosphate transport system auxiliary subunit
MPAPGQTRILAAMVADLSLLLDEIEAALREPPAGGGDAVARVEETLTDGYASVLQLEAERLRLERRFGELARDLQSSEAGTHSDELADLSQRLSRTKERLRHLRARLAELRLHAEAVRAA